MNGRNRHAKYKRRVYRNHSIATILISVFSTLAVVFVALLIIGNILHQRSIERHQPPNDSNTVTEDTTSTEQVQKKQINGRLVYLEASDSTNFKGRLEALKSTGASEASIPLNTADGTLLYTSAAATAIGLKSSSAVSLASACTAADELEVYTSGRYFISAFSEENKLLRASMLANDASVIAEALSLGIDEVIIVAPQMSVDNVDEIIRLFEDIKFLSQKGYVGLAVNDIFFEAENTSELIAELNESFDLLAIDTTKSGDTPAGEYVDEKINSAAGFYIRMYEMRILLPYASDNTVQEEIIAAAEKNAITNWQIFN